MKRLCALFSAFLLTFVLAVPALAEGEAAASEPVMLPGVTPVAAVVAGMAIAVSVIGWWTRRNDKGRRL